MKKVTELQWAVMTLYVASLHETQERVDKLSTTTSNLKAKVV